ncbi:competence protein, partial [Lactobacillus sp. XV13L]|nr:competence protein [Lactobacillus sp. XV13L]
FYCPRCGQKVQLVIKAATAYFKHAARVNNSVSEKEEHARSKKFLQSALRGAHFDACLEVSLAGGRLRADVLASPQLAFEVQCAPLGSAEFSHRHALYHKIGVRDIWVVGRRHYLQRSIKKTQLIFFRENRLWRDYYLEINPYREVLTLKYNVKLAPLSETVHCQAAIFALNAAGLARLWHFRPVLKDYRVDPGVQRRYLQQQVVQKSIKGMCIAAKLYENQMTIADLPAWVFSRLRRVHSCDNASFYLKSGAGGC